MSRPSSNLLWRFDPPTVCTCSITDENISGTEPQSVEAATAFQSDSEKLKNNGTTILKWGYSLQHLWWICDTGCYKHHTYLKLTGDVKAWSSHAAVIRRRELHKCFMRYICCSRGTKGLLCSKSSILFKFQINKIKKNKLKKNTFPKWSKIEPQIFILT